MKQSQYNNFIHYDDSIVGYNAFSNSFIILENDLYELYKASVRENKIQTFQTLHPDFFDFMVDKGFFISKNTNEFKEVKSLQEKIDYDDTFFDLFINPTMNCNFKCWYCYETHIKDSKMSEDMIENVIKLAKNIIKKNSNLELFYLSWFGGEPLLQYKTVVLPLLKSLSKICLEENIKFESGFTTNGLLITQEMIDSFKLYNVDQLQITLDGKKSIHNKIRFISSKKGSYDEIIKNIILLAENDLKVIVRINCVDETLDGLDDIMKSFSILSEQIKKNISFTFHRIWQVEKGLDKDISEYIDKYNGLDFNVTGVSIDSFRDSCYADKKNQAIINYNGDVFKCSARDFSGDKKEGELNSKGEIIWNNNFTDRMNIKFKNKPCQECSILPICGGGCSQIALESLKEEYCMYDFDEQKKKKVVLDTFLSQVSND